MLSALLATCALFGQAPPALTKLVEVPFDIDGSAMVVPATIHGQSLRMIFDTGFGGEAVVEDSVDMGKPAGYTTLRDFVGTLQLPYYKVSEIKLGDLVVKDPDMEVQAQAGVSEFGAESHVDGLMGFGVIKNFVTEINFEHTKFVFHPSSEDLSVRKPDNKKTFLLPMQPIGTRSIVLLVQAPDGRRMNMSLDTGNAFYATTHRDVLERLGLWTAGQEPKFQIESGVASGVVASWYKDLKNMTIFGVPVSDSTWDIIDLPSGSSESDGTVGFQFLQNFNITFDFKRRLVWMENFTGKVANQPEGSTGLSAFYIKSLKGVVITRVAPESPADKAGIKKGDMLIDVDDNDLTNIGYRKLHNMLVGTVGSKLKLSFSHLGIAQRVTLTREALVNP
ncbi:MAG TPA: PDZ domain-containing protein [Fimbriimonadaceae bacterium]|nr:PDZ domain-containing protein [Fimbriimonadaceae bacterium]